MTSDTDVNTLLVLYLNVPTRLYTLILT